MWLPIDSRSNRALYRGAGGWKRGFVGGTLCGISHVSGTRMPSRISAQYAECFSIAWNVNGLFSRYTSSISATFFSQARGRSYHHARRSMTSAYRGRDRRSKGSFMIRSVRSSWPSTGPRRPTSASNAAGQSSSVPRSRPMTCSGKARQMMRDLPSPRGPVVRHVMSPEIHLVPDALLGQKRTEALGRLERAGRVLPLALAAHEQHRGVFAQPVEVLAAEVRDVVHRVVEIDRV